MLLLSSYTVMCLVFAQHFSMHHLGILLGFFIAVLAIDCDERRIGVDDWPAWCATMADQFAGKLGVKKARNYLIMLKALALGAMLISVYWTINASICDIRYEYSSSRTVASFIKTNHLEQYRWMAGWTRINSMNASPDVKARIKQGGYCANGKDCIDYTSWVSGTLVTADPYFKRTLMSNAYKGRSYISWEWCIDPYAGKQDIETWRSWGEPEFYDTIYQPFFFSALGYDRNDYTKIRIAETVTPWKDQRSRGSVEIYVRNDIYKNVLHSPDTGIAWPDAAGNVKPQIETMQGIRQTAQDSITFAQGLDDPDRFAAHIETVQQYMDDYDRLADTKQIKYLLSDNLQERIIGLLYRNQQRTIIDSMRVAAHNLDAQTKELLSAVDAAMADDFSQHAAQWLLQVDDPTQVNELIDRYGKQREYSSMREMLTGLESLHKLRSDVKQQVSSAVNNLHSEEASAAAIAVPERNGDLDPAGWYTLATNVVSTMGVQIEQTMEFNCGGQSGENPSGFVAAYYCQMPDRSQRNVVHILTTHPDWTQTARSPWLVDMVKHELSHRSIMISCGTTQPTIAADRTEAVTNSYSVLFFGADRDRITNQQQGVAEYAMDASSDQLATAIHDGNCG